MKHTKLIITIPQPCNQNLNAMQSNANGKFCTHCNKTVIDFTAMTNQQLFNFFKTNTGNVCGSFYSDQLNTIITQPPKPINKFNYIFTLLIGLCVQLKVYAQTTIQKQKLNFSQAKVKKQTATPNTITIKGKITDTSKQPIAFATIILNQANAKTITNNKGYFTLTIPKSNKQIQLTISHLNYVSTSLAVVANKSTGHLSINLQSKATQLEEVILKTNYYIKKQPITSGAAAVIYSENQKSTNCNDSIPKSYY